MIGYTYGLDSDYNSYSKEISLWKPVFTLMPGFIALIVIGCLILIGCLIVLICCLQPKISQWCEERERENRILRERE